MWIPITKMNYYIHIYSKKNKNLLHHALCLQIENLCLAIDLSILQKSYICNPILKAISERKNVRQPFWGHFSRLLLFLTKSWKVGSSKTVIYKDVKPFNENPYRKWYMELSRYIAKWYLRLGLHLWVRW